MVLAMDDAKRPLRVMTLSPLTLNARIILAKQSTITPITQDTMAKAESAKISVVRGLTQNTGARE